MSKNRTLQALEQLLKQKKSNQFYAEKLGISEAEVRDLKRQLYEERKDKSEAETSTINHNIDKGTLEVNAYYKEPPTPEQIIEDYKIDNSKWKLSNFWSKACPKGWLVSAYFSQKPQEEKVGQEFMEFLKNYKPQATKVNKTPNKESKYANSCLIINKQDVHYNKLSTKGDNNIEERFDKIYNKIGKVLRKASATSNIEKTIYVLGSDLFNSEFTGMTTHGTPQQNIGTYQSSFEDVCNHEIAVIDQILHYSDKIDILYIRGNHDAIVSWHLVNWLKMYYRNNENVSINTDMSFSKYVRYNNTALMFNHGYKVKAEQLAQAFPIEFKSEWAKCDNYYIMVGDLHTELSKEIGGIKFFRLAQMSKATSAWDEEMGYTLTKGEMTAFLIEDNNGITDTYREIL